MLPYNREPKGIFTDAELLLKYVSAEGIIGNTIFVTDISGISIKGKAKYRQKQPTEKIENNLIERLFMKNYIGSTESQKLEEAWIYRIQSNEMS